MDIEIKKPSLYRLIYRYVNVNNNILRGQVKLKPHNPTDVTQSSEVFFQVTTEPMFVTVGSGRDYEFVLNPGRWTVSISSPDILLLVRNFVNCLEIYAIILLILTVKAFLYIGPQFSNKYMYFLILLFVVEQDYMVLVPDAYYEATVLQEKVTRPCKIPGDQGP